MRCPVLAFFCLVAASGCYSYLPLGTPPVPATPTVGARVRLALTNEGSAELARFLGPSVAEAEGSVVSLGGDGSMLLAVDFVTMRNNVKQPWTGEGTVTFPASYIAGTRQRTFQKRRSVVASVAGTAALIAIAAAALKIGGASGGPGNGQPPPP